MFALTDFNHAANDAQTYVSDFSWIKPHQHCCMVDKNSLSRTWRVSWCTKHVLVEWTMNLEWRVNWLILEERLSVLDSLPILVFPRYFLFSVLLFWQSNYMIYQCFCFHLDNTTFILTVLFTFNFMLTMNRERFETSYLFLLRPTTHWLSRNTVFTTRFFEWIIWIKEYKSIILILILLYRTKLRFPLNTSFYF